MPKPGNILSGQIISISKGSVVLDLGSIGIGIVYPGEFYDNPDRMKGLKTGDKISAMLIELENDEGYRELSLKSAQMTTAWQDIKEKKDLGEVISTKIVNINKGGLIVEVSGIQGFLPLSQLSSEHYPKIDGGDTTKIVQALQKFKGQEFKVKILDFNEAENKLIVSEKAIREEVAKEELAKLKVGDLIDGKITEVTDFGAFVKISDTLDGLVHSSEIDWKFIEDPREVLHSGNDITAKIISLDGGRVSLSLKALKEDPWLKAEEKYQSGQKIKGRIIKIRNNGAFVELPGDPAPSSSADRQSASSADEGRAWNGAGIIAFLPVAELGELSLNSIFETGKDYDFAIVSLDPKEHKMVLTLPDKQVKKEEINVTLEEIPVS